MNFELRESYQLPKIAESLFRITENIAKRHSVLNAGEKFNPAIRKVSIWALGLDVFKRETFDRESRSWHWRQYKWKELIPATIEGIEIEGEMALADRDGNETKIRMFKDKEKKKAWGVYDRARENPENADHGWPHERRIERLSEMFIMGVDFLRHGAENIRGWIQIPFLYSWNHDMDQAITEQRNIEEGITLKPKAMHAEAAGIMLWLVQNFIGESAEIKDRDLLRQVAGTMIIDLVHDKPELIDKRLNSQVIAAELRHDPIALLAAWDSSLVPFKKSDKVPEDPYAKIKKQGVNVYSLTLADVMMILRMGKAINNFVTRDTPNGLHPDVEKIYKKQLKNMGEDYSQTLGQMINFKDENDERAFRHTLDICVIADLLDMLVPPRDSLIKKFLTQISWQRPLFRKMPQGQFINLIIHGEGNIATEVDSDLRRLLWEAFHTFDFLGNSEVGSHPFVQGILDTLLVENIQFIKQVIPELMVGNRQGIKSIFEARRARLKEKAKRKIFQPGFNPAMLSMAEESLTIQQQKTDQILNNKPVANDKGHYDDRDLALVRKYINRIVEFLNIPADYRLLRLPYDYDPIGPANPKVVHEEVLFDEFNG